MSIKNDYFKINKKQKLLKGKLYNLKLRKFMIASYNNKGFSSPRINGMNSNHSKTSKNITISDYYYKNPYFYNEQSLNVQLKVLKELQNIKNSRDFSLTKRDYSNIFANSITNNNSISNTELNTKYSSKFISHSNENKQKTEKNKINLEDTFSEFQFPNISKIKDNNSIKVEINNNYNNLYNNVNDNLESIKDNNFSIQKLNQTTKSNKSGNLKQFNLTDGKNTPIKVKENDNYVYKIIFKSKPLFKSDKKIVIDNKFNMKYAENEDQYKRIVEKEYKILRAKGKKIKKKNISPSIKLKLKEAKDRIHFMKGIIDYSYPGFILSKIKVMQKRLHDQKNDAIFKNNLSEMELRDKEKSQRNYLRKKYLLNSITLLK